MLANVRDRIPEIGLRRALGATSVDVRFLFVAEACLVTVVSAVIGLVTAVVMVALMRGRFGPELQVGISSALVPLAVSLAVGVAFSYWPAKMAASISPAEALRND